MMENFPQFHAPETTSKEPFERHVPTEEELEDLRNRSVERDDGYHEYIDRMVRLGKPIELSDDGKIIDLNSGYIHHRIEDRLALQRDAVTVSSDEGGKLYAYYLENDGSEHQVGVLPEDETPY